MISRPKARRTLTYYYLLFNKRFRVKLQPLLLPPRVACKGYSSFSTSRLNKVVKAVFLVAYKGVTGKGRNELLQFHVDVKLARAVRAGLVEYLEFYLRAV